MNLLIFSLLGGTSSILRNFLGGTSQKRHPVYDDDDEEEEELGHKDEYDNDVYNNALQWRL